MKRAALHAGALVALLLAAGGAMRFDGIADRVSALREDGDADAALATALAGLQEHPSDAVDSLAVADLHQTCGQLLRAKGSVESAVPHYRTALDVRRGVLGESDPAVAIAWNDFAVALFFAARRVESVEASQRALAILDRNGLGDDEDAATCHVNLANTYRRMEEYDLAREHFEVSLRLRRRLFGESHLRVASVLEGLARLAREQRRYDDALDLYREALAMERREDGDKFPGVARNLREMALVYHALGDTRSAEPLLLRSLALRHERDPHSAQTLDSIVGIARMYQDKGQPALAREWYERGLRLERERIAGPSDWHVFYVDLLRGLEDWTAAEQVARRLVNDPPEGVDDAWRVRARIGLANALIDQGRGEEPEARLEDLTEATIPDAVRNSWHWFQAKRRWRSGDCERAIEHVQAACAGERPGQDKWRTYAELQMALLELCLGRDRQADDHLAASIAAFEAARGRAGRGFDRSSSVISPYPAVAVVAARRGRSEEAWTAVESFRGRTLEELRSLRHSRAVAESERRVRDLEQAAAAGASIDEDAYLRARTELAERERDSPSAIIRTPAVALDELRGCLAADEAVVGWIEARMDVDSTEAWGYVVRADGAPCFVRLERDGRPSLANDAVAVRDRLAARLVGADDVLRLSDAVLRPLEPHLEGARRLIVVGSGVGDALPIELLRLANGDTVLDRFEVEYVPAARFLVEARRQPESGRFDGGAAVLAVGDVPFHDDQPATREAVVLASAGPWLDTVRGADSRSPLPWSALEVAEIRRAFPNTRALTGRDASEQTLVALADSLASFDILHFATHADVSADDWSRCTLVLSQVGLPDPLDALADGTRVVDGLVSATEIVSEWKLRARLVTLSACRSALGLPVPGEGHVGLASAFLVAGAQSVLVSVWPVNDRATALLMSRFYAGLAAGAEPAASLRDAKLALASYRDEAGRDYSDPFYWTGFVLIGDGGGGTVKGADR